MNSKEVIEFITKLIDFTKEQINYFENKIIEDEQYPTLQQCHKEELIAAQEGFTHLYQIKQDLERLEKVEKENEELKGYVLQLAKDITKLSSNIIKITDVYMALKKIVEDFIDYLDSEKDRDHYQYGDIYEHLLKPIEEKFNKEVEEVLVNDK